MKAIFILWLGFFMDNNWHDIPWYEGKYQVNWHTNQVRSINYNREWRTQILKLQALPYWHLTFSVHKNKITNRMWIHQAVMLIKEWPCPEWMEVCHNDSNSLNNFPDNLRYDTRKNNVLDRDRLWRNFFFHSNPSKWKCWPLSPSSVPVLQLDRNWSLIKEWCSVTEAGNTLSINKSNIVSCCRQRWRHKTAWGFKWKYK